jgi:hypothetical protein
MVEERASKALKAASAAGEDKMKAARTGCDAPVSRPRMLQAGLAAAAVGAMGTPAEALPQAQARQAGS